MNYETILVDVEDGVGTITLNRPDKLNAMNRKLSAELHDAVKALNANDDVGCIVVTGAGPRHSPPAAISTSSAKTISNTASSSSRRCARAAEPTTSPPRPSRWSA